MYSPAHDSSHIIEFFDMVGEEEKDKLVSKIIDTSCCWGSSVSRSILWALRHNFGGLPEDSRDKFLLTIVDKISPLFH